MSKLSKANRILRKTANGNGANQLPPMPKDKAPMGPITPSTVEYFGVNIDNTQRLKKKNERKQTERVIQQRILERKLKRKEERNKAKAANKKAQKEHKQKMKKMREEAKKKKKQIKSQN